MGEKCRKIGYEEALSFVPALRREAVRAALYSPHEVRVESRTAIPLVTRYLAERYGVEFRWQTSVTAVQPPRIETSNGPIEAETAVICPGDDFSGVSYRRLHECLHRGR